MKKLLMFCAACMAISVYAGELTVADGSATSEKAPVDTYNGDCYSHHQMIYPAALLQDMKGTVINSLTFHMNEQAPKELTAVFNVSMAIVAEDHFTASWSSEYSYLTPEFTKVYEGTLDASQPTIVVPLNEPFAYADGNLLLDIQTKTPGNYASSSFIGDSQSAVTEIHAGNMSAMPSVPSGGTAFLPKTTFSFGGEVIAPCVTPGKFTVFNAGTDFIYFEWTPGGEETQWEVYVSEDYLAEPDWSKAIRVSEPKAKVEGLQPATYYGIFVRSACDGDRFSDYLNDGLATRCAAITEIPWIEDFENSEEAMPMCWYLSYGNAHTSYVTSMGGHNSRNCLFVQFNEPGSQIIVMPEFDVDFDTLAISFWYNTADYNASLELGYMVISETDQVFVPVSSYPATKEYAYVENASLKAASGAARLAFRASTEDVAIVYIDDMVICKAPEETPEAISNQQSAGINHKYLKEGQLVIIHNGVRYNALGIEL